MRKNFDEFEEQNENEIREIEKMLNQMEEDEEEDDILIEDVLMSKIAQRNTFIDWLKENGIIW